MLVVQVDTVASYGSRASEATKNRRDCTARHGPLHDKSYEHSASQWAVELV